MSSHRAQRVAGEIADILATLLRRGVRDPRVTPITITSVRVSPDLSVARVNYVPLGGEGDPESLADGLASAGGYLRRQLGRQLRLRITPELHWHLDQNLEKAIGMTRLLDQLAEERAEREGTGDAAEAAVDGEAGDDWGDHEDWDGV